MSTKKLKSFKKTIIISLVIFSIFSIILAVSVGSVNIDLNVSWRILLNQLGFNFSQDWTSGEELIILHLRLPRVLMAFVVGAMLAIAGVAAQGLFKNPIADPYIIGISSASGFGAAFTITLGLSSLFQLFTTPLIAFAFASLSVLIVYKLSQTTFRISMAVLLLAGIAISYFFSALTSFTLYFAEEKTHYILSYLMGRLWGVTWQEFYLVLAILIPCSIILYFYGQDLNLMVFNDDTAQTMGVNVEQSKKVIIILMTVLTSSAVAFCGSIGFIGLIIPHIMRLLVGSNNRTLIPLSALGGGILLIWADLIARTIIPPLEIPVGIFTSLMGAPFFLYLVLKKKNSGELA